ncbi:hypothetical protein CM318V1_210102 [Carnobacterium maltaromaticum]|uniref:hypothetical protein n=1 Tax=Carnobacterium maltaromaticum TaxID=2751 RepID=UPI00070502A7|nr:hypothetical protein [Carnobacterium maltaromaticum]KRN72378.1 hypothetical protein IV76_GL002604 [Carnobacterium maltaromaticum]CRH18083.1 hypothetical protein CM318V1_210102 [Carnobacterium maltaromaticum]
MANENVTSDSGRHTESNKKNYIFEVVTIVVTVLTLCLTAYTLHSQVTENKKDRQLESVVSFRIKQLETVIDSISEFDYQSSIVYDLYLERDKLEYKDEKFLKELSRSEIEAQQTLDKILLNLNENNQYYKEIKDWVDRIVFAYGDPEIHTISEILSLKDEDNVNSELIRASEELIEAMKKITFKPTDILKKYIAEEWKLIDENI